MKGDRIMKWSVTNKLSAVFGFAISVALVNAIVSYQNNARLIENEQWEKHSHQVLAALESTLSTLKDAETGRGYLLVGDDRYLEPYFTATAQTNKNIQQLKELTADDPSQQQKIIALKGKVAEKLNELQFTITLRKTKGLEAARQIVLSGKGKRVMDEIRQLISQMENTENVLLEQRTQESQASSQNAIATLSLSVLFDFALLGLLYYFAQRDINQRQLAETALKESNNRLRTMIETEPECVKLVAEDGTLLEMNAAGLAILEVESAESVLGKSIYSLITPEYREAFQALHESVCQGNKGFLEFEIVNCKGNRRWVETRAVPWREAEEVRHLAIARDITDRKQMQEQVEKTEARLRYLLTSSPAVIYSCQSFGDYAVTFISDNITSMLGYASRQFLEDRKFWANHIHLEDAPRVFADLAILFEQGHHIHEYRFLHQDGSYRWVRDELSLVLDPTGEAIEIVGYWIDISDRKHIESEIQALNSQLEQRVIERTEQLQQANQELKHEIVSRQQTQEALRESERRFRAIFNQTFQFMGLLNPDGTLLEANQTALDFAGITAAEVVNRPVWEARWWSNSIETQNHLKAAIQEAAAGKFIRYEVDALGAEDQIITIDLSIKPVFDDNGQVVLLIPEGRDISDRKLAEAALRQAHDELEIRVQQRTADLASTNLALQSEIADRLLAEEALRESEERWQLALRGNNDGIWDWNVLTNEVFFSSRWKEMLGYEDWEIDNNLDEWAQRVHPDDIGWVSEVIQEHFAKKTPFYISEHRVLCKDGSYKWILDRGQALWDENDRAVRMTGSHTDISDRKAAEEELKRQNLRSQLLAEITLKVRQSLQAEEILQTTVTEVQKLLQADRVLIFRIWGNGSGTVEKEAVLPGFPIILGQQLQENCFQNDYYEQYRQGRIGAIADIETANIQSCHREFLQQFDVKANLVVPILQRQELWGLLIAHQCAVARHWSREEIELLQQLANQIGIALSQAQLLEQETRQRQELARSNAELEQFAYVASHDLQEPLRMVTSYIQLLQRRYKGKLDDNADEFISYAVDGAARMQSLIQDLLRFSRVSTRAQPFEPVDCETILNTVLSNLKMAIQESGAVVTHEQLPTVMGDSTQITQLFQNLIGNAIKFRRSQSPQIHIGVAKKDGEMGRWGDGEMGRVGDEEMGRIKAVHPISPSASSAPKALLSPHPPIPRQLLQAGEPVQRTGSPSPHLPLPSEWLFWVQDNGIGIEPQYSDRIFVIFKRLHAKGKYPGTGIGLAICKKIVERHGGRIWVESEPDNGSVFYFTIPDIEAPS